jgi:hypothetical protein
VARLQERLRLPVTKPLQAAGGLVVGPAFRAAVERRARRDYALLRSVVDARLTETTLVPTLDPADAIAHHAWVQVLDGDSWVDYDPTMPEAEPGQVLAPAAQTADDVAAADRQAVTLRVVTETLTDGVLAEATPLEVRFDAADAAARQILLLFQAGGGGGGGLLGEVGTSAEHTPLLLVDGVAVQGGPFSVLPSEEAGGGFADFGGLVGGATGELSGLYLDAVISVPGRPDETYRRVLLDRIPADTRTAGAPGADQLAPLVVDEEGPLALRAVHHVMISTGGSNPRSHASAEAHAAYAAATELAAPGAVDTVPLDVALWPMTVGDERLVVGSEHAIVDPLRIGGLEAFVGHPRVTVTSLSQDPAMPFGLGYSIDLLADGIDFLVTGDADLRDAAMARLWYGALGSALETETVIAMAPALAATRAELDSASLRSDDPTAEPTIVDGSQGLPNAPTAMRQALAAGLVVVTPDPVTTDAWWTVDLTSGSARSVLDPGLGMAGARGIGGPKGGGAAKVSPVNSGAPLGDNPSSPGQGQPGTPAKPEPKKTPKGHSTKDKFDEKKAGNLESQLVTAEVGVASIPATTFIFKAGIKPGFVIFISAFAARSSAPRS